MSNEINLEALAKKKKQEASLNQEVNELVKDQEETSLAEIEKLELTPEERAEVDSIKSNVDLLDSQKVVTFGVGAQRQLTQFSDNVLNRVRSKDTGKIGDTLTDLSVAVRSLDIDGINEDSFWSRLPWVNNFKRFMAKYETVEVQIDKIETQLEDSVNMLLKDIGTFDTLYDKNLDYYNDLALYIKAGDEIVEEAREKTIPALLEEAENSDDQMAMQLVKDFEDTVNRFEQKVHNLKLSRTISMQTAPQIRLIQNNDKLLIDKVQTAIMHTLPLWKNQIVIALGLRNQKNVLELNRKITDATNTLLRENSEMLKQNTIEVAKETQRGIVDIETLKKVNTDLIETIEETMTIQQRGRAARQEAELELHKIEGDLRTTLLSHIEGVNLQATDGTGASVSGSETPEMKDVTDSIE